MNGRDCRATFHKSLETAQSRTRAPSSTNNENHLRKTRQTRNRSRGKIGAVSIIMVSCFSPSITRRIHFFFSTRTFHYFPLHDTKFLVAMYPSSLTLSFHHRFHFPSPLFAYKVATHPNVTFYLKIQDVEIEEPCFRFSLPSFPFLSPFFFPLSTPSVHFSTGLRLIIGILCFLIFPPPIRWFPSFVDRLPRIHPPRVLDSIRENSYTPRVWFLLSRFAGCDSRISRSWTNFICIAFIYIVELCW